VRLPVVLPCINNVSSSFIISFLLTENKIIVYAKGRRIIAEGKQGSVCDPAYQLSPRVGNV
jgi:hypothetical protein